jgi:hypothetical protein
MEVASMTRVQIFAIVALLFFLANAGLTNPSLAQATQANQAGAAPAVAVPAGTKVEIALTRPVWAKTVRVGDAIYGQTAFPVVVGSSMAIPAGTYVQGTIESVVKPSWRSNRATFRLLFTTMIFADGYTVMLAQPAAAEATAATGSTDAQAQSGAGTRMDVTVQVNHSSDILLDNGTQVEMTLGAPLALDAKLVAEAIPLSRAVQPGQFKAASLCRPTAGTPGSAGTPDTVIPGSPGTPDTVIPGGPGMPDTVIPGTPATPATVIPGFPGSPGTPGTVCPSPPIVVSSVPVSAPLGGQNAKSPAVTSK